MGKYKTVLLLCQVPEQIKKQKSPAAALPDIFMLPGCRHCIDHMCDNCTGMLSKYRAAACKYFTVNYPKYGLFFILNW